MWGLFCNSSFFLLFHTSLNVFASSLFFYSLSVHFFLLFLFIWETRLEIELLHRMVIVVHCTDLETFISFLLASHKYPRFPSFRSKKKTSFTQSTIRFLFSLFLSRHTRPFQLFDEITATKVNLPLKLFCGQAKQNLPSTHYWI